MINRLEKNLFCALTAASLALPSLTNESKAQIPIQSHVQNSFFVNDYLDFSTPDTKCYFGICNDKQQHFLGQAGVGIMVSTPIIPRQLRNSFWKRMALGTGVSVLVECYDVYRYERRHILGQPGYGFSYNDVAAGIAGQLTVEGLRYVTPRVARAVGKLF